MCGLYSFRKSPEEVKALFGYPEQPNFPPRDHVAPGQPIAIVRGERDDRHFALVRWGFVPSWTREMKPGKLLINAGLLPLRLFFTGYPSIQSYIHRDCLLVHSSFL